MGSSGKSAVRAREWWKLSDVVAGSVPKKLKGQVQRVQGVLFDSAPDTMVVRGADGEFSQIAG